MYFSKKKKKKNSDAPVNRGAWFACEPIDTFRVTLKPKGTPARQVKSETAVRLPGTETITGNEKRRATLKVEKKKTNCSKQTLFCLSDLCTISHGYAQ